MITARALVLDVAHRVLALKAPDETWHAPATVARVGERPLVALTAFARERLGLALPWPSGALPASMPHDFVFVLPPGTKVEASDARWIKLRELAQIAEADALWALYVDAMLGGWEPPTRELDVFFFASGGWSAANLAHMVVKGSKRATALWRAAAERKGETIPTPGMVSVVTDGFGFPQCVIQSERVDEVRFGDCDEAMARDEGEGDKSLDDWRDGHRAYFEREAGELGIAFDDDATIVFERFRVLKVLAR